MKIYFLDDDYMINRFHELTLKDIILQNGCSVEFFDNPVLLMEKCTTEEDHPNVIFLDINMPVMDGWDFMEEFNKRLTDVKTKFIILTTSNDPSYIEKSKSFFNVHAFANKPLKKDKLMEVLSVIKNSQPS